ncbi:hypothetical protein GN244_ATG15754 [Phytophthora infestans]|uniref:Uncharacterized protein n=1 Tax=Phytophthora infestans TaxID=4787 RepID=A0A833SS27_PHYIN|nr:hypothetical protein GN244_ATG15754 [Phytophthora infestans]
MTERCTFEALAKDPIAHMTTQRIADRGAFSYAAFLELPITEQIQRLARSTETMDGAGGTRHPAYYRQARRRPPRLHHIQR